MLKRIIFAVSLLAALPVSANEFYRQNPPEVARLFKASAPTGVGVYRQFMLRAYEAAYWQKGEAKALSLTYFWDIEAKDINDRTEEEMRIVRPNLPEEKIRLWRAGLDKAIPNVVEGERITAIYDPKTATTTLFHQGQKRGTIKGADFADAFFAIWLDENSTAQELRAKLLGK